jgi:SSS family transporter
MNLTTEYFVIGAYMAMLIGIALVFRNFNRNAGDYFRSGCRGKWWLVGTSAFMAAFSAWTFTGAAGVAYASGWSVMIIFMANAAGFFVNALFTAPWFRQLRAISSPEVISLRFGERTRLFYAILTIMIQIVTASLPLYALAIFCSAVFNYNVQSVILVVGGIVLFYSLLGGSWAVMATDFVQSLVLLPLTVLIAILCLSEVGGVEPLFTMIKEQGLTEPFQLINNGEFKENFVDFTWLWAVGMFVHVIISYNSIDSATRYFSVKDGKEARYAALLAGSLMLFGSLIWFLPPVVSRLLYSDTVSAMNIANPAEASYAVVGLKLLPAGMTGLMVVAIFAATMSSMDTGLNRNAAIIVNDIFPAVCRKLKIKLLSPEKLLLLGQVCTLGLGMVTICVALVLSQRKGVGIFEYMQTVNSVIAAPIAIPLFMGLFIRRAPYWSAMFAIGVVSIFSAAGVFSGKECVQGITWLPFMQESWNWQTRIFINYGVGICSFLLTVPFWRTSPESYKKKSREFFKRMTTPIDFAKEVGEANDGRQLKIMGSFATLTGTFVNCLIFLPGNDWSMKGRSGILFVGGTIVLVGLLLILAGHTADIRSKKKQ